MKNRELGVAVKIGSELVLRPHGKAVTELAALEETHKNNRKGREFFLWVLKTYAHGLMELAADKPASSTKVYHARHISLKAASFELSLYPAKKTVTQKVGRRCLWAAKTEEEAVTNLRTHLGLHQNHKDVIYSACVKAAFARDREEGLRRWVGAVLELKGRSDSFEGGFIERK